MEAFAFGSRILDCPVANQPDTSYTIVHHAGQDPVSHDALAYDELRGWGYEVLYSLDALDPNFSPYGVRDGSGQFGPFDNSPNNRTQFPDTCPDQLYDSFIGAKDFLTPCDQNIADPPDPNLPCDSPDSIFLDIPEGIIFRVDVPNGLYRFVAAVGSADNPHAHRIIVEDGGFGPPEELGPNHVVLVHNFDQAEYCAGTFARVGFDGRIPPEGTGPQFVNMDNQGLVTNCPPNSPVLEVTEGYIRLHQLQANSNAGSCAGRDANGGDMVVLELWRVPDGAESGPGLARSFNPSPRSPGDVVTVTLEVSGVGGAIDIEETVPAGWTITDAGGGTVNGDVITFNVAADTTLTYQVRSSDDCAAGTFTAEVSGTCISSNDLGCTPADCGIQSSGAPKDMLIIGPIQLEGLAGPDCDDMGRLADSDYIANEEVDETNILVAEDNDVAPDWAGGLASGIGVLFDTFLFPALNPLINPAGPDDVLTVWKADADADGRINFNDPDNIGHDPASDIVDYVVYSLIYLENTTAECVDSVLEVGSDDAVKVRVNGALVHVNSVCRGIPGAGAGDMVPVSLAPGVNIVLIAVVERGGGTDVRLIVRNPDGTPLTDGRIRATCDPPAAYPDYFVVERTIDPPSAQPGDAVAVTLSATGISDATAISDTFPAGLTVADDGGGTVNGNTITFQANADGDFTYELEFAQADECPFLSETFSGSATSAASCGAFVGDDSIGCVAPPCPTDPEDDSELMGAFAFGPVERFCPTFNDPGVEYTTVLQIAGDPLSIAYNEDLGYGYEILYADGFLVVDPDLPPPIHSANGWEIYGPMDDSVNDRNDYPGDTCPEALYDSFIGGKNFLANCDQTINNPPDPNVPCAEGNAFPLDPDGIIFRVDVPPGKYRFVAAVGDADNVHAHRIIAENGGFGPPTELGPDHVVLVHNFDQAQQTIGETEAAEPGEGVYARVGFKGKVPPPGDGVPPSPQFVNMDENGMETPSCPESPTLDVTEGYIRIHQLQANSNDGPGGPRDPNGGDMVVLEVWRVGDIGPVGTTFVRGDADSDSRIILTDGIVTLSYLFLPGGTPPACFDAADADDNGRLEVTDPVLVFTWLFVDSTRPPQPPSPSSGSYLAADCGLDPTDTDTLDCVQPGATCE